MVCVSVHACVCSLSSAYGCILFSVVYICSVSVHENVCAYMCVHTCCATVCVHPCVLFPLYCGCGLPVHSVFTSAFPRRLSDCPTLSVSQQFSPVKNVCCKCHRKMKCQMEFLKDSKGKLEGIGHELINTEQVVNVS